jgi:hypothetical protein
MQRHVLYWPLGPARLLLLLTKDNRVQLCNVNHIVAAIGVHVKPVSPGNRNQDVPSVDMNIKNALNAVK